MKWLLKQYMAQAHIDSMEELAMSTGIAKRTLYNRIENPKSIRIYELVALDGVLHFKDDDLVRLAKGASLE